jgi:glutathione S-transferase
MTDPNPPALLITIPVSHYCEKARWALRRAEIAFVEERHMPPFHRLATQKALKSRSAAPAEIPEDLSWINRAIFRQVGGQSVPLLVTDTEVVRDSDAIVHYADSRMPEGRSIYPTDPGLRQAVDQWIGLFDEVLAPAVRRWAYSYLMAKPALVESLWCEGVPGIQRRLFPLMFGMMRSNVQQLYGLNETSGAESYRELCEVFDRVDLALADGRSYLVGDRFSAADLGFATLAAAIVSPEGYGGPLPDAGSLPGPMAKEGDALRGRSAGQFVLRLYREEGL